MIYVNKHKLSEAGMSASERYFFYRLVEDKLTGIPGDGGSVEFTVISGNYEISYTFVPEESNYNEETGELEVSKEAEIVIYSVGKYDTKELLESYGLQVEKSGMSNSLYFKFEGEEYRLSDHKRPAYEYNGVWYEWEDEDYNIIREDIKDMYKWAEEFVQEKGLEKKTEKQVLKEEPKKIDAPKENVSRDIIVRIQMLESNLKELILEHARAELSIEELIKKVDQATYDAFAFLKDKLPKPDFEQFVGYMIQQMRKFAREWYYVYTKTLDVLARNTSSVLGVELEQFKALSKLEPDVFRVKLRDYITVNKQVAIPVIEGYQSKVKAVIKSFAFNPPKAAVRKGGKIYQMSLRNRAESLVRYMANMEDLDSMQTANVKLVWITSHPNCSKRCEPYQGKLYSLDGTSGFTKSGIKYTPLAEALKGPLGDGNGILNGYNCRHRAIEYTEGSQAPREYSEAEIAVERAIDGRQRTYENNIRQLRTEEKLLRVGGFKEEADKLKARHQRLMQNYEQFSQKNGRAFYRWRCEV